MATDLPMPGSCVFLLAGLPGIWLAGRLLARRILSEPLSVLLVGPGLGLAAWLLAVHFTARWTGSFLVGLWAGTASVALAGLLGWVERVP